MANIAIYKFNSGTETLPVFDSGYEYTYTDESNGDGTITRTIVSNTAPSNIRFDSLSGLIEVNYINTTNIRSLSYLFNNCANLTHVDLYNIDTVNVTDMSYMFAGCSSLSTLDLSAINTSNVLNMNSMFMGCSGIFSLDIKSLNTSKVTGMNGMFQDCTSLSSVDMSGMNISSLTNIGHMFNGCTNLLSVKFNGLDLNNNINLTSIFEGCLVLNNVSMDNCSIEDINNMINYLPQRSGDAKFKVNNADLSGIATNVLTAKNWTLASYEIVVRYTFNRAQHSNLLPNFNTDFTDYVVVDESIVGNIVTRAIGHENKKPTLVRFGVGTSTSTPTNRELSLREVLYLDTTNLNNMEYMFNCCYNLTNIHGIEDWNTGKVTNMHDAFAFCYGLTSLDLSRWDTSKLTNVIGMFYHAHCIHTLNVTGLVGPSVNNIQGVFRDCHQLTNLIGINTWDVTNVIDFTNIFKVCQNLINIDISNWNNSQATLTVDMFAECHRLQTVNIGNIISNKVTSMQGMFYACYALTQVDTSNWDTSRVTNMYMMFYCCRALNNLNVSNWDTSNLNNVLAMFFDCTSLTSLDVSNWYMGKVTNLFQMFYNCQSLTSLDLSRWDVGNVTTAQQTFESCQNLTTIGDTRNWNTGKITNLSKLFKDCRNLVELYVDNWDTSKVTDMGQIFNGCLSLRVLNVSNWDTSKVTIMHCVFGSCYTLDEIDVSNWDVHNVINMRGMFGNCRKITSLDVSNWDTSKVTDMSCLFEAGDDSYYKGHQLVEIIGLENWNTSNVTNMNSMFHNCRSLSSVNVSNWDTSKVTDMATMFYKCNALTSLDLSRWDVSKVTNARAMFYLCLELENLNINNWNTSSMTDVCGMFYYCNKLTTLDLSTFDATNAKKDDMTDFLYVGASEYLTTLILGEKTIHPEINDYANLFNQESSFNPFPALEKLVCPNVNMFAKIQQYLPDRSGEDTPGIVATDIASANAMGIDIEDLSARNWLVGDIIAEYRFDAKLEENILPVFNDEYTADKYMIIDDVKEYVIEDLIIENGAIFGNTGSEMYELDTVPHENLSRSEFTPIVPNTVYECNTTKSARLHFCWYDENKTFIRQDYLEIDEYKKTSPVNARYLRLWGNNTVINFNDIVLTAKTITRTIVATTDELPTIIRFGYRSDADAQVDYPAHGNQVNAQSLLDVYKVNISNISTFVDMFRKCERLYYINTDGWVANKANYVDCIFQGCISLQELDLSNFITSSITSMHGMFADCFAIKSINVTGWDLSNVRSISYLFCNCASMTELIGIENWNTSNIEEIHWLFYCCQSIRQLDLSKWNTSKVINCNQMFRSCLLLTSLDVSTWDTRKVTEAIQMFLDCHSLTSLDLSKWKTGSLKYTQQMFNNCYSLTTIGDVSNWDVSNIVNVDMMFESCRSLKSLNVGTWNVSNWASLYALFHNCHSLTSLGDIGDWNTSNINNMYGVFYACLSLSSLDLSKWDTSNVTTMHALFGGCRALTSVGNISHWNTSKVTTMSAVFWSTPKLEKVDVRGWDISNVSDISGFIHEFDDQNPIKHTLDITNFKLNSDVVISEFISNTLQYVKCNDSDTINILANYLPARNGLEAGILITDDKTGINLIALTDKNWNVITIDEAISLAEYKFDNRVCDYVPTFNDGFKGYFLIDSTNSEDFVIENYIPSTHQPEFSAATGALSPYPTGTHTVPAANVITRKIICINLPSLIRFGAEGNGVTGNTLTAPKALLEVNSVNFTGITDKAADMFRMCTNVKSINIDSRLYATDIHDFCAECRNLENITGLNNIDLGNCIHIHYAFVKCDKLKNIDLSSWDVSHAYSIAGMFAYCVSLETVNLTGWQTNNTQVTDLMFVGCVKLTTITGIEYLNMTKVTDITEMFRYCQSLTSLDLSRWNVSAVKKMDAAFCLCTNLTTIGDVSNWNVSSVTSMNYLFERCFKLEYINVTNWNTINLQAMMMIFFQCKKLQDVDMSNWKTGNVTSLHAAFTGCTTFTTMDLHKWDVSKVTNFYYTFSECSGLTYLNLSGWNTSKVNNMSHTFYCTSNLTEVIGIENWDVRNVTTMEQMFAYSGIKNLDLKNWKTSSKLTNMSAMFIGAKAELIDLSNFNTSNVTSFYALFNECYSLSTLRGIENFNTSKVNDMRWMFAESYRLTSLDVSKWNVEKVASFATMFYNTGIREIDVSNWNTASLTGGGLRNTFGHCTLLNNLDISNFKVDNINDATKLFYRHVSLKTLNVNNIKLPELRDDLAPDMKSLEKLYVNILDTLEALLPYMPDRIGKDSGKIVTSLGEKIPDNVIETLNSKNWNIIPIIAHYKYDPEEHEDLLPVFNNEFNASEYNVIDNERVYTIDNVLWESGSLDASGNEYADANYPNAARSAFISVVASTTIEFNIDYCNVYWYDSNRVILNNCGHIFGTNEGLENGNKCRVPGDAKFVRICRSVGPNADVQLRYRIKDRLIESVNSNTPYIIRFGSENWEVRYTQQTALLEVTECNMVNATTAYRLFGSCTYLKHVVISNITDRCQNLAQMCHGCSFIREIRGLKDFDTRNVVSLSALVQSSSRLQLKGDEFVNWNTEKVTNMDQMFYDCHGITTLDLSKWDTRNVTHMHHMFYRAVVLTDLNITGWDVGNVQLMNHMFYECSKLTSINTTNWNTRNVKDMSYMFTFCEKLTSLDVSNWNTGNVTNMDQMFAKCKSITTLAVDNWDTSKVTKFYNMFAYCSELQTLNLSKWQTGNVWTMNGMFIWSNKLTTIGDISKWDVRKVEDMGWMFERAESLSVVKFDEWQTEKLDRCNSMFAFTNIENITLRSFNTNLLRNINNMFTGANMKLLDISNFNLNNVTDSNIANMLTSAKQLKYIKCNHINTANRIAAQLPTRTAADPGYFICKAGDISSLNSSVLTSKHWNVVTADQLHTIAKYKYDTTICKEYKPEGFIGFIDDIEVNGNIKTRVIEHVNGVLPRYLQFGTGSEGDYTIPPRSLLEIIDVDMSNVTDANYLFRHCQNLTKVNWSSFNTSKVKHAKNLFTNCYGLKEIDLSTWDFSNVTELQKAFKNCRNLTRIIGVENLVKSKVISISELFYNCPKLTNIYTDNWDTSNIDNMDSAFYGCTNLLSLDVSNFNTSKVKRFSNMFNNCNKLTSLDVSNWDTSNCEYFNCMFDGCRSLVSLDVSNFNTSKANTLQRMFAICNGLTELDVSRWNTSNVTNMQGVFFYAQNIQHIYGIGNFITDNVIYMSDMFHAANSLLEVDVSKWNTHNVTEMHAVFWSANSLTELDVSNWDVSKVTKMSALFGVCQKLQMVDLSNWDTSNVTTMSQMFAYTNSLKTIKGLSDLNTSNVTDMSGMFNDTEAIKLIDISGWDTRKVTNMNHLFRYIMSVETLNINNLIINEGVNITETDAFISGSSANKLSKVYVNDLHTLEFVENYLVSRNGTTAGKIVSPLRNKISKELMDKLTAKNWEIVDIVAQYKFDANVYENLIPAFNAEFTEDKYTVIDNISEIVIDEFDWEAGVCNTENGKEQAASAGFPKAERSRFLNIIPNIKYKFNVNYAHTYWYDENKNFISYTGMVGNDTDTNENVPDRYIISPENAKYLRIHRGAGATDMTITAKIINRTIESVNGDLPTVMRFGKVNAPTEPSSNSLLAVLDANMSNITTMANMFDHCNRVTKINTAIWDVSKVTNMEAAFAQCGSLTTLDVSNWDVSNVTNLYAMFQNCKKLTSLNLSKWNISNVISTSHLFYYCNNLTTIGDIGKWNTSNVTNMRFMFAECHKLSAINVSGFDTSKVFSMKQMFYKCLAITELNVSNFDTSNVTDMNTMFHDCNNLTKIDVSGFDTSKVTDMYAMFHSTGLKTINLSNFDFSKVTTAESLIGTAGIYTNINNNMTTVQLPDSDLPDSSVISNFIANRSKLKYIKCNSKNNIVKLVNSLPTRTAADPGKILTNIPLTEFSDIVVETLAAKNWAISNEALQVVAKYKFAKDICKSALPLFNNEFTNYFVDDEYLDNEDLTDIITKDGNTQYTVTADNIVTRTISVLEGTEMPTVIVLGAKYESRESKHDDRPRAYSILDVETLNIENITRMHCLFRYCYNVSNINTADWDTSKIVDMEDVFTFCYHLTSVDISGWDTSNVTTMRSMFYYTSNLTSLDVSNFDTSKVTDMENMFVGCKSLTSIDVTGFDTSKVTKMYRMFAFCESLSSLDVSNFDTSKVTNMHFMFRGCNNLTSLDVSNWDTGNVTNMSAVFQDCQSLASLDVSNWDTSKVTNMSCIFYYCPSLTSLDVSNWDTGNVTDMGGMFCGCQSLTSLDVSNFDTSKVVSLAHMFNSCINLTSVDVSNFDTTNVTSINGIFNNCPKLRTLDISDWDTSNLVNMDNAFYLNGSSHIVNLNNLKVDKVTVAEKIFHTNTPNLTKLFANNAETVAFLVSHLPDRSSTTTGRIIMPNKDQVSAETVALLAGKNWHLGNLIASYKYDSNICEDLIPAFNTGFGVDKYVVVDTNNSKGVITRNIEDVDGTMPTVVRFGNNVEDTPSTNALIESLDMNTKNITSMLIMFQWCKNLKHVNTSNWDTSNVTDMSHVFTNCYNLQTVDVGNFDTSKVTSFQFMFTNCSSLLEVNTSNWDTGKVRDMYGMFWYCPKLTKIDTSNWNTSNVVDMKNMFFGCYSLASLDVSNFDTSKVTNMFRTFAACHKLVSLDISNFDTNNVTNFDKIFEEAVVLEKVTVNDLNTANSVISQLPNRTGKAAGTLVYYDIDPALLDTPTLQSKNWNLSYEPIMAKYIFDSNAYENFLPITPSYLQSNYEVIDDVKADGRVVRTLKYRTDKRPTRIVFGDSSSVFAERGILSLLDVLYVDIKENITDMNNIFAKAENVTRINTRNWDTSNVTTLYCAFYVCKSLKQLEVGHFKTDNVSNMTYVFNNNKVLESVDVTNWNTSNVTSMCGLFAGSSFKELNLSNWDTSKVTNMDEFFAGCINLSSLNISNFVINESTNIDYLFGATNNLEKIDARFCSTDTINKLISTLPDKSNGKYGKIYIINNNEHELINKNGLDNKNWKAVIRGGNIKAVHIPNELFQSLGLGNVMVKHVHIGERFL